MIVLAIDTSTPVVTAGVVELPPVGAPRTHAQRLLDDVRAHTERLTPLIGECLAELDAGPDVLDAVVVGVGPGPFTGLRVGIATAISFGDALGIPVHPVCSLDAIAAAVPVAAARSLLVVTDARRREVYYATYDADRGRIEGPGVVRPDVLSSEAVAGALGGRPRVVAGPLRAAIALSAVGDGAGPTPEALVACAADALLSGAEPEPPTPLYLRRPDAVPPTPRPLPAALRGVDSA